VLAEEHVLKAIDTADNLYKEIDSEWELSTTLKAQVDLLNKHLEAAKEAGQYVVKMYIDTLEQFGVSTFTLPEEPMAFNLFSWLRAHLEKLPAFVGGAVDFGAVADATNFSKHAGLSGMPSYRKCVRGTPWGPL
jgi:hypothetical protein